MIAEVSIVVAVAQNGAIGEHNSLPWRLPTELRLFRSITLGHPVVMGRRTFDSIGKPLPGRDNIVISRGRIGVEGVLTAFSLTEALLMAGERGRLRASFEIMVIGGGQVYAEALSVTDRIYLTEVETVVRGDTFFPSLRAGDWRETRRQSYRASAEDSCGFTLRVLQRRRP